MAVSERETGAGRRPAPEFTYLYKRQLIARMSTLFARGSPGKGREFTWKRGRSPVRQFDVHLQLDFRNPP